MNRIGWALFISAFLIGTAYAEPTLFRATTFCTGEHESQCPAKYDYFIECADIEKVAENHCTLSNSNGNDRKFAYFLDRILSIGGEKCGYNIFKVTCVSR
jgi:hypothetical protein